MFSRHFFSEEKNYFLVVFEGSFPGRVYRFSRALLSRFFFLQSAILLAIVFLSFLSFKLYRTSKRADPSRVIELERQIQELQTRVATNKSAETAKTNPPSNPQTVIENNTTPPSTDHSSYYGFSLVGNSEFEIDYKVEQLAWRGKNLSVRLNLENSKGEGTFQGSFFLVAQGDGWLLTYPAAGIRTDTKGGLLDLTQGESFSFSRLRAVQADLGPIQSKESFRKLDLLIFNKQEQLVATKTWKAEDFRSAGPLKRKTEALPQPAVATPPEPEEASE